MHGFFSDHYFALLDFIGILTVVQNTVISFMVTFICGLAKLKGVNRIHRFATFNVLVFV